MPGLILNILDPYYLCWLGFFLKSLKCHSTWDVCVLAAGSTHLAAVISGVFMCWWGKPLPGSGTSCHRNARVQLQSTGSCSRRLCVSSVQCAAAGVLLRSAAAPCLSAANCCSVFSLLLQFWKSSHCCCCSETPVEGPGKMSGAHASLKHYSQHTHTRKLSFTCISLCTTVYLAFVSWTLEQ